MSEALRFVALIAFVVALAVAVRRHAAQLRGRGPGGFLAFLGAGGWLILTLASGVTVLRPDMWILGVGAGGVGALCVLAGYLLRGSSRA